MSEPLSFVGVLGEHEYYERVDGVAFCTPCRLWWTTDDNQAMYRAHLDSVLREHVREAVEALLSESGPEPCERHDEPHGHCEDCFEFHLDSAWAADLRALTEETR